MPTNLQTRALEALAAVDRHEEGSFILRATKWLRDTLFAEGQPRPSVPDAAMAVRWALAQPLDVSRYLTDSQTVPSFWRRYEFPNGHSVSVIVDPRPQHPFRFEVESTDPADVGRGGIVAGLSTAEVEAKLAGVAALPAVNPTT